MPFDSATTFMVDYLTKRRDNLTKNKALTWSTDSQNTLKAMIDEKFFGQSENDSWERMKQKSDTSGSNQMISIRNKIGWLAACNRDLRSQFAAATDCRQRVPLDHTRYSILRLSWALKGLNRFIDIVRGRATK